MQKAVEVNALRIEIKIKTEGAVELSVAYVDQRTSDANLPTQHWDIAEVEALTQPAVILNTNSLQVKIEKELVENAQTVQTPTQIIKNLDKNAKKTKGKGFKEIPTPVGEIKPQVIIRSGDNKNLMSRRRTIDDKSLRQIQEWLLKAKKALDDEKKNSSSNIIRPRCNVKF